MKDFSAFLDMRRCMNWTHKIFSSKYLTIWRPVLPVFPRTQISSFLLSTLNSFQGLLLTSCSGSWFDPCRGRWQVPICRWQPPVLFIFYYNLFLWDGWLLVFELFLPTAWWSWKNLLLGLLGFLSDFFVLVERFLAVFKDKFLSMM